VGGSTQKKSGRNLREDQNDKLCPCLTEFGVWRFVFTNTAKKTYRYTVNILCAFS
jgi:hypothetical protein